MNLDDLDFIHKLDRQNMLGEIDHLPDQLKYAWELGQSLPLPDNKGFRQVIISGMGGSAIGADLLAAFISSDCKIPVFVQRDYSLPAWAYGPKTLVIASSHSGNTEETLEAFTTALANKCSMMAIATGGKLAERAEQANIPLWKFEHKGQPRAAVGFSFGLLLAAISRLGLISDPFKELSDAITVMKKQQESLTAEIPLTNNPAKRLAGQLVEHWVNVYASGCLVPVARRWKTQINEIAKAGAGFEFLPEADHNALAGLLNPADILARTMTLFLHASSDHPRNHLRLELTRHGFTIEGLTTDIYEAMGDSRLAHIWTALHFGDYASFYLAMAYGSDPTPVEVLEKFKASMRATG